MRQVTAVYYVNADAEDDEDPEAAVNAALRDLLIEGVEPVKLFVDGVFVDDSVDPEDGPRIYTDCTCGNPIVLTPEGWQHDCAPWFWGDDHDATPTPEGVEAAKAAIAKFPEEYEGVVI